MSITSKKYYYIFFQSCVRLINIVLLYCFKNYFLSTMRLLHFFCGIGPLERGDALAILPTMRMLYRVRFLFSIGLYITFIYPWRIVYRLIWHIRFFKNQTNYHKLPEHNIFVINKSNTISHIFSWRFYDHLICFL